MSLLQRKGLIIFLKTFYGILMLNRYFSYVFKPGKSPVSFNTSTQAENYWEQGWVIRNQWGKTGDLSNTFNNKDLLKRTTENCKQKFKKRDTAQIFRYCFVSVNVLSNPECQSPPLALKVKTGFRMHTRLFRYKLYPSPKNGPLKPVEEDFPGPRNRCPHSPLPGSHLPLLSIL